LSERDQARQSQVDEARGCENHKEAKILPDDLLRAECQLYFHSLIDNGPRPTDDREQPSGWTEEQSDRRHDEVTHDIGLPMLRAIALASSAETISTSRRKRPA
jgi:hypothetical protein